MSGEILKRMALTAVVTKAIRFLTPIDPIRESKIAASTCRDLNPPPFRLDDLVRLSLVPF